GQITGVEGYAGNIATGLLAGCNAARLWAGKPPLALPPETMLGALCQYITHASAQDFQPMKANYGIMPELEDSGVRGRRPRAAAFSQRALAVLDEFLKSI
ncbi:MAG TPA: FAD-dependent oxidoreductase, partial [Anaerolineales bacterium]|nr:FAD-dependent oxidoreductase [Anaerolineales bacterium]